MKSGVADGIQHVAWLEALKAQSAKGNQMFRTRSQSESAALLKDRERGAAHPGLSELASSGALLKGWPGILCTALVVGPSAARDLVLRY